MLAAYRHLVSTRMLSLLGLSLESISREHMKLHRCKKKRSEVLAISSNWLKQHLLTHIILKHHISWLYPHSKNCYSSFFLLSVHLYQERVLEAREILWKGRENSVYPRY